jgi:predicted phosphoribosyltransferase
MRFHDRQHAGRKLASALSAYRGKDVVVYALPRGGVVLGKEIADLLQAPLDLLIPRKIGHPKNEEYAIAAVTETGEVVRNEAEVVSVDPAWFKSAVEAERLESARRREFYLGDRPWPAVAGKIALIVDDGMATGLTMKAAIADVKNRQPKAIVVAVPVAPRDTIRELQPFVDRVVTLEQPLLFLGAIGASYDLFDQVTDEEVVAILSQKL